MQRKLSLLAAAMAVAATASAQVYQRSYVEWPNSSSLPDYVNQWSQGTLNMEDENFFVSRVKPKARFRNAATQVNTSLTAANDKRLIYWVPVGDTNSDNGCNALPNGRFDSEMFSMWSYLSHYGDWTAPHGWVPGAFADVAHKNGVAVSGVASIPFGGLTTGWSACLSAQAALSSEDMAKFLHYHGVDGLGYNSEFSGGSTYVQKICGEQHPYIINYLIEQGNPVAENIWYDGTNWNGGISFDQGLASHNQNIFGTGGQRRASLFFNYNWGRQSNLTRSVTKANELNIDPLYIYAGFNMQGNDPGTNNWTYLKQNNVSVGLWGAHANNMHWLGRNSNGSSPAAMQRTYLTTIERYFGNGPQNPAISVAVKDGPCNQGVETFFGMSALMTAKSTLAWNLAEEPFVTYFNLGNGAFFNWKGERQNSNEWANIGVQDYLPTWRYWWAPTFLGRSVQAGDVALKSTFTWDDAYVGGSCLKISGTSEAEAYLHLFKTQFPLQRNDVIRVSYKLNRGAAKVSLVFSAEGAEETAVTDDAAVIFDATAEADDEVWVTKEIVLNRSLGAALNGRTIAMIALKVENAADLDFNLGELSITRGTYDTPAAPQVTLAKVLRNHYRGVDGKLIWNMPNDKPARTPVYNSDVKASLFKLYSQAEGQEPVLCGITTSWAGLFYSAPMVGEASKVRFGVAAVNFDHSADSDIAWSEWLALPEYEATSDITISKTTLKPGEGFTVSYVDPRHAPSSWTIYDNKGVKVSHEDSATSISVPEGYEQVGGYDVVLDEGTPAEKRYGYFVQVSGPETGAVPEIYTTSVNGQDPENVSEVELSIGETVELAYTGRPADGAGSRAIALREKPFGVQVGKLGIQANQSFSVAGWVKLTSLPNGISSFVTIENRAGSWPANNWGFFWSRIAQDGRFVYDQIDTCWGMRMAEGADGQRYFNQYDDAKIGLNSWTHFAIVFEYQGSALRSMFYLNGVKQVATNWLYVNKRTYEDYSGRKDWIDLSQGFGASGAQGGSNSTDPDFYTDNYPITSNDWISFGGTASNISAVDGVLDDFQVWGKAMTDADVKTSMAGLDPENLPADVIALWNFENEPLSGSHGFKPVGTKKSAYAYSYEFAAGTNEGTAGKVYQQPTFTVGCPFISGSAFKVVTEPVWTAKRATLTNAEGTGESGHATLSYAKAGDYNVTLTLSNSHGSDSRTFPVFKVGQSAIDEVAAEGEGIEISGADKAVFVEVEGTDAYTVSVVNAAGAEVARAAVAQGGDRMVSVRVNATGVYVVNVITASGSHRAVKLIVK